MSQASLFEFFKWMLFNLFEMFKWMLFNWAKEPFYICVEVAGGSALCIFPTIISECQRVRKALLSEDCLHLFPFGQNPILPPFKTFRSMAIS